MSQPKDLIDVVNYLEGVFTNHKQIKQVLHGYPDEQSQNGQALYPQVWLEADIQLSPDILAGHERYSIAIQILDKPERQGTVPHTRAQFDLLQKTKTIFDQCYELIFLEQELRVPTITSGVSLNEQGDDLATGWRYELSFVVVKKVNRTTNSSNFNLA